MALSLSQPARDKLKNLLICLSLGNLCFLRRWYDLEHLKERSMNYYRTAPANQNLLWATLLAAILLTTALWLGWHWVERRPTATRLTLARSIFLLLLIFPLESVRRYWNDDLGRVDFWSNFALLTIEVVLAAGLVLAWFGNLRILHAARRVALMLTLLFPSLLIDFTLSRLNGEPASAFVPKPPLPVLSRETRAPKRVIWLLFDEFDQRLAFEARQPSLDLPELDRLRAESFVADHTKQTAAWTILALPSLLSGRGYKRAELVNANSLRVYMDGSATGLNWADEPNVFRRARAAGANPALIGWHHPYCRVLGDSLVRCLDVPGGHPTTGLLRELIATDEGVLKMTAFLFRLQFENVRDMLRTSGVSVSDNLRSTFVQKRQQQQYFQIRDAAYGAAADPHINLLVAHFPAPHLFAIYDRHRRDFTLSPRLGYFDNLALVDRTVGEVRSVLERAGLWDNTTILVSSDHGLRPELWHGRYNWTPEMERLTAQGPSETVPFIIKLANQNRPLVYNRPFSAVVTGDVVLAILSGEVSSAAEIAAWLDYHCAPGRGNL